MRQAAIKITHNRNTKTLTSNTMNYGSNQRATGAISQLCDGKGSLKATWRMQCFAEYLSTNDLNEYFRMKGNAVMHKNSYICST